MNQFKRSKVIMLPTENRSVIALSDMQGLVFDLAKYVKVKEHIIPQHLYIISDEEIKEGDWYISLYVKNEPLICQYTKGVIFKEWKKIIATTDISLIINYYDSDSYGIPQQFPLPRPSQQFIEKYIESYNKEEIITDVLVEYDYLLDDNTVIPYWKLKINPKDNTITIKKLKDNWNKEEVIKLLDEVRWRTIGDPLEFTKDFNNWINQNL